MAVETNALTVQGTTITITADGAITPIQEGGPAGAWTFQDSTGARATVKLHGQAATSVLASHNKAFIDAVVTAWAAAIA